MLRICLAGIAIITCASNVFGQANAGGFGNTGLQPLSAFGFSAGGTGTPTSGATSAAGGAGGTAPDAPASGETDVYTFMTINSGTTWYGFLAGDAMA